MKIAILDDYQNASSHFSCVEKLREAGELVVFHAAIKSEEELAERLKDVDIVLAIRERTWFTGGLLERLPKLKLISQTSSGVSHIDLDAATRLGILVSTTGRDTRGTIELTIGLILAVTHNIAAEDRAMRSGKWQTTVQTLIHGKILGILGLGHIGSQVARIARSLGMKVIAWSPTLTQERAQKSGAESTSMREVLGKADIVSIHLRLTEQTRGLIGWEEIKLMKKSAFLINTARGAIVDEAALIKALRTQQIAGAGLDVFHHEPIDRNNPLLKMDNVVLTPHIGFVTDEGLALYFGEAVENILNFLSGNPTNLVNKQIA